MDPLDDFLAFIDPDTASLTAKAKVFNPVEPPTAARRFCGPAAVFPAAAAAAAKLRVADPRRARFRLGLERLDEWFCSRTVATDPTVPGRWAALSAVARAGLGDPAGLASAKEAMGRWASGPERTSGESAEANNPDLFGRYADRLAPWTPGSWAVWDALNHLNGSPPPTLFAERTPVLLDGGTKDGQVVFLVVEGLPGPPGLVTPDAWRLGLTPFQARPTGDHFAEAVNAAIGAVAGRRQGFRLRWHLDGVTPAACNVGLVGASGQAAAAMATLAVYERFGTRAAERLLAPDVAITGMTKAGDGDPMGWPVVPVTPTSLPSKFRAAHARGYDVAVAADQEVPDDAAKVGCHVAPVGTLGAALDRMRSLRPYLDNYRQAQRTNFCYHPEATPARS